LKRVAEEIDPKEFVASVSRPTELGCPECHGHNLTEPDDENLIDCMDCGIWFNPTHPNNLGENVDPKEFVADQAYLVRTGIGAQTRYLQRRDGQAFFIDDPDEATAMFDDDAVGTVDALHQFPAYADARIEMAEKETSRWQVESDEIDVKAYADETPYECVIQNQSEPKYSWSVALRSWSSFSPSIFPSRARAEEVLATLKHVPGVGAHAAVVPAAGTNAVVEAGPLDDDGLPGEVTSFLRNVRNKRKKAKAKPVL